MVIKNLKKSNRYAEEEFVWRILSQLVTALYRCHYGTDAPEVGSNILGPPPKPSGLKGKQGQVTILHRDLKPENIFLGNDNAVKLGDFGLSKLMRSHDFASTYVGTPFYMSPEICAAERYTLRSDIWAVGCIMYELCQKEPPFNARTHIQLIQKIRDGKYAPLPDIYSTELKNVIASCLRVNPDNRPDTAALVNLPIIRLMRKEKEIVDVSKTLRKREETAIHKLRDMEQAHSRLEKEKQIMKADIDNTVRREWEVKARLEIDRQVRIELDRLRKRFELEVQDRVSTETEKCKREISFQANNKGSQSSATSASASASASASGNDSDFPSSTDLSQLSMESPTADASKLPTKKETRTPFTRSKTVADSPMDIQMEEPSPISIASLSLSPRRTSSCAMSNIFADPERQKPKWEAGTMLQSDDEDDIPDLPSPTRPRVRQGANMHHPMRAPHRPLLRQNTTSAMRNINTQHQPPLFPTNTSRLPQMSVAPTGSPSSQEAKTKSPRRLSKIPSSANLIADVGESLSPSRKNATKQLPLPLKPNGSDGMLHKAVMQRNMGGRTLVELAQARAGGRSIDEPTITSKRCCSDSYMENGNENNVHVNVRVSDERDPPAVWDPERDEMPSPFLVRGRKVMRNLR